MVNVTSSVPTKFVALTINVAGASDAPLSCPVVWFRTTPIGSDPTTDQVIVGDPVASNLIFNCCLGGAVRVVVVIVGAVGMGPTVRVNRCAGDDPVAFVAITSKVMIPTDIVLPLMTPVAGLRLSPNGSDPFSIDHTTGVVSAMNLK